jgi:hypothetical protein
VLFRSGGSGCTASVRCPNTAAIKNDRSEGIRVRESLRRIFEII